MITPPTENELPTKTIVEGGFGYGSGYDTCDFCDAKPDDTMDLKNVSRGSFGDVILACKQCQPRFLKEDILAVEDDIKRTLHQLREKIGRLTMLNDLLRNLEVENARDR